MKGTFGAELIGFRRTPQPRHVPTTVAGDTRRPWVARITGPDGRYGLGREFLQGRIDFRHANRSGSRGVMLWWTLDQGHVYELRYRRSWDDWVSRYVTVADDGELRDLTEEEVWAWVGDGSASSV